MKTPLSDPLVTKLYQKELELQALCTSWIEEFTELVDVRPAPTSPWYRLQWWLRRRLAVRLVRLALRIDPWVDREGESP